MSVDWSGLSWCITGGESGPHLSNPKLRAVRSLAEPIDGHWQPRPDRIDWIRSLRDECTDAGVKFFHKQWGGPRSTSAGRMLDGRYWNEIPRLPGSRSIIANKHLAAHS